MAIEAGEARIVVGPREALATRRLRLRDVNWLGRQTPEAFATAGRELFVKVRSTRPPAPARIVAVPHGWEVEIVGGEEGVAPGQACVFYAGEGEGAEVLGGGVIAATARAAETDVALHAAAAQP